MKPPFSDSPRPWPPPASAHAVDFDWHDLLFMHWPVNPDELRLLIPSGLAIDKFDGQAWIGVVPFRMSGVRPHSLPALPWISNFLELNVRTYVVAEEKPGVWFFSLDAANPLAVRIARRFFNLPYFDARMQVDETSDGWVEYTSQRTHRGAPPAEFSVRFRPVGPAYKSREGSLDHWLTAPLLPICRG